MTESGGSVTDGVRNLSIGYYDNCAAGDEFNGTIDEFVFFNRSLTLGEIAALYSNRTDIIYSEETSVDDVWLACVTGNDGSTDGAEVCSNNLTIETVDITNPNVTALIPAANSVFNVSNVIEIAANVTDGTAVSRVLANVTYPNGTINQLTLANASAHNDKFNISFTIPELFGTYNLTFIANDTLNNINSTETSNFKANSVPVISSVVLNTTDYPTNSTNANLTLYWEVSDEDNDSVKNITDWRLAGTSLALINLPFEGGSSADTSTKDYSTFEKNGTVANGTVWNSTGGYDGFGAYQFDGIDDVITTGLRISDLPAFTVSFWAYPNTHQNYNTFWSADDGAGSCAGEGLLLTDNNQLVFRVSGVAHNTTVGNLSGKWVHIVALFNASDKIVYLNGTAVLNESGGGATFGVLNLSIGYYANCAAGDEFNGTIDEFVFFNRSLTLGEITALYSNRTDIIYSEETSNNDVWQACVTGNDMSVDSTEVCSNNLTIIAPESVAATSAATSGGGSVVTKSSIVDAVISVMESKPVAESESVSLNQNNVAGLQEILAVLKDKTLSINIQSKDSVETVAATEETDMGAPVATKGLAKEAIAPVSKEINSKPISSTQEITVYFDYSGGGVSTGNKVIVLQAEIKEEKTVLENEEAISGALEKIFLNLASEGKKVLTDEEKVEFIKREKNKIKLIERENVQPLFIRKVVSISDLFEGDTAENSLNKFGLITGNAVSDFNSGGVVYKLNLGKKDITYSGQQIMGKLLESYLEGCGEITVKPGEKFERTCTVHRGISASPAPLKIKFKASGEEVLEKEVDIPKRAIGVAVDMDNENNLMELYMLIPQIQNDSEKFQNYFLEFTINEIIPEGENHYLGTRVLFADLYGPFLVRQDKGFVFAQQLEYNPAVYFGNKVAKTKLLKNEKVVAEHEFNVDFGNAGGQLDLMFTNKLSLWALLLAIILLVFIPGFVFLYLVRKHRLK